MNKFLNWCRFLSIFLVAFMAGCKDDCPDASGDSKTWEERTVAVVLPMANGLEAHWKRTLGLFSANFQSAFRNQASGVRLNFEYYDESSADLAEIADKLGQRDDVYAVIGGLYSVNAQIIAGAVCRYSKPFFTLATCEELVRAYTSTGQLWAMTETDITQCEVLLSKVINYGGKSVALVAKDNDAYGKTFIDWFAFQAKELGLEDKGMFVYDGSNVSQVSSMAAASGADYLICVPSEIDEIAPMIAAVNDYEHNSGNAPRTLFSDTAYGADVLASLGSSAEGIEGVTFGADPESGFEVSYKTYFGVGTTLGEPQLYDAAMLIGYAAWYQSLFQDTSLQTALRTIVSGKDMNMGSWMGEDMRLVIDALADGSAPYIRGASGSLDFDSKVFTNVLNTTYYNYKVYNGAYLILDYNTSDGSNRTDATLAGWNWKASQMQDFSESGSQDYSEQKGNWALLAATSDGWSNYRHQADILAIYQLLKSEGYPDDHIILIMEDDIAMNQSNPYPGVVRVTPGGENLYEDVEIDYRMSDIDAEDFCNIMQGVRSERLDKVVGATENDNLFIFWSGHGVPGGMCWGDTSLALTSGIFNNALSAMSQKRGYRKMMMMVEACFSGGVMEQCTGYPGMLFVTAADSDETSKADVFSEDLGVWMSNRFTSTFVEQLSENPAISMRDLYYRLFINTVGSHVMVYNDADYGNLYSCDMEEYIRYRDLY